MSFPARRKKLIFIACGVFLIGFIAKIPAGAVLQFAPDRLQTRGITGTLWSGNIEAVAVDGQVAGPLSWQLKPLSLLVGTLAADIECSLGDGFFTGAVAMRSKTLTVTDAKLAASLGDLTRTASIGPSQGTLNATVTLLELTDQWPTQIDADITVRDLQYSGSGPESLGSYRVEFSPASTNDQSDVVGNIQSIDGPFDANGTITLGDDRSYALDANVRATGTASKTLQNSLKIIGPASADGSHALSLRGSF